MAGRQEVVDNHDKYGWTGMVQCMLACWGGNSMQDPGGRSGRVEGRRTLWAGL